MEHKYKIILSHPGQQHSFKTAAGLKKNRMLYKYFTTVYQKKGSLTSKVVDKFLKGETLQRSKSRYCFEIDDEDVMQKYEMLGLISIFITRIFKSTKIFEAWNNWVVDVFGMNIARYATKWDADAVISYDNNSSVLFKRLKGTGVVRILDTSAANRLYMQQIYEKDIKECGEFRKLYGGTQLITKRVLLERYRTEIEETDYFLVGSNFVKKSLMFSGVTEDKIKVVPYGVDIKQFKFQLKQIENREIRFLFVGNVNQIKGIYYLFEAFKMINNANIKLTVVGNYTGDLEIISQYDKYCDFIGCVPKDRMPEIYENADVLIFPSLGEGFGQVVLEAMACGLPVIVSDNVGANEVVVDSENGFIIPIQSVDAIVDKINWFNNNKSAVEQMSINARKAAELCTWNTYEKRLGESIKEIMDQEKK